MKGEEESVGEATTLSQHPGALINRGCSRFPLAATLPLAFPALTQHSDHWLFRDRVETENRAHPVTHRICREWCMTWTDCVLYQSKVWTHFLIQVWSNVWLVLYITTVCCSVLFWFSVIWSFTMNFSSTCSTQQAIVCIRCELTYWQ